LYCYIFDKQPLAYPFFPTGSPLANATGFYDLRDALELMFHGSHVFRDLSSSRRRPADDQIPARKWLAKFYPCSDQPRPANDIIEGSAQAQNPCGHLPNNPIKRRDYLRRMEHPLPFVPRVVIAYGRKTPPRAGTRNIIIILNIGVTCRAICPRCCWITYHFPLRITTRSAHR